MRDRITVDGAPVKRGDRVWFVERLWGSVRCRKIQKHELGDWHWSSIGPRIYVDERNAIRAALEGARRRLRVAQRDAIRERKNVEKFKARLAALPKPVGGSK